MKQYTSRELSEKLVKLGCKSQSGMTWIYQNYENPIMGGKVYSAEPWHTEPENELDLPAFEFEDFCGTHRQALLNLTIIAHAIINKNNPNKVKDKIAELFEGLLTTMGWKKNWLSFLEETMELIQI